MEYNSITRMSNEELDKLTNTHSKSDLDERIKSVITFYLPQINNLIKVKISSWKDKIINDLYIGEGKNKSPHILSKNINLSGVFQFDISEQFIQCAIVVCSGSSVYYNNIGLGTLLHAIKEDIARIAGYSFLMYTDTIFESTKKHNHKIMDKIGAKEVFRGMNTRSNNMICMWIKDLTEYYKTRNINKQEVAQKVEPLELPF